MVHRSCAGPWWEPMFSFWILTCPHVDLIESQLWKYASKWHSFVGFRYWTSVVMSLMNRSGSSSFYVYPSDFEAKHPTHCSSCHFRLFILFFRDLFLDILWFYACTLLYLQATEVLSLALRQGGWRLKSLRLNNCCIGQSGVLHLLQSLQG